MTTLLDGGSRFRQHAGEIETLKAKDSRHVACRCEQAERWGFGNLCGSGVFVGARFSVMFKTDGMKIHVTPLLRIRL